MITIKPDQYVTLPDGRRAQLRVAARRGAQHADAVYADLLAAEAGIAARAVFPDTTRLVFALAETVEGSSASLVAASGAGGKRLWHAEDSEWPDECRVTERLAAAWDWYRGDYFPPARENPDLLAFELDP